MRINIEDVGFIFSGIVPKHAILGHISETVKPVEFTRL